MEAAADATVAGAAAIAAAAPSAPALSRERVVFQTKWGDIEFGFFPEVAPVTARHIFKLVSVGAYTGNHIFRVDRGFVAQVADVVGGRDIPLNAEQQEEGVKTVPLEVRADVRHTAGVLSMGRFEDPASGKSSFSMLLGDAPHLDMQYTIFGKITKGLDVLHKLEGLETRREGIFVMPKERVAITATYWYREGSPFRLTLSGAAGESSASNGSGSSTQVEGTQGLHSCAALQEELDKTRGRAEWLSEELQRVRRKCLPG
ncbi:peptidyl-prolyl cis-trans isomerase [Raphidocelis subcapitata]|uniref:Peptidyl-prolyl cis-trans isomerase n=1 Tax=Raphidocelis subcapitata TaxID=307507 RepID=A0A2V0NYD3_9CHLO|nr:peptidyl-prolyl cis-trans isomerase [Raphidocelis subcapitata]|eukprot:GBF92641.1 peptidyl-prolyl cis-trans isomerase [Raphidocelis subcapitata]